MPDIIFAFMLIRPQFLTGVIFSDIVDDINEWIEDITGDMVRDIMEYITEWIADNLISGYTELITLVNNSLTEEFWDNTLVLAFLDFSQFCCSGSFAASVVFLIFDCTQEITAGKSVAWINVFKGFAVGFMFARFSQTLPVPFCKEVLYILSTVTISDIDTSNMDNWNTEGIEFAILIYIIMFTVLLIATIVFMGVFLSRQATTLVHLMTAMFYIPDTVRGDTTKMGEWLRQLVAICATTFFQYMLFFGGTSLVLSNPLITSVDFYIGIGLIFGTFSVPKILNRFGYSVGNRDVLSTVQSAASTGFYIKSLMR